VAVRERPGAPPKAARAAQERANAAYEAGRLDEAVEGYRAVLAGHPAHWDAWNNLALAEMHRGNDLVALFLLSALTKNSPRYAGGAINLSVCLERLGQDLAAYHVAAAAAAEQAEMPLALYNLAWFENLRGRYEPATGLLARALEPIPEFGNARWLRAINAMEAGGSASAADLEALPAGARPAAGAPRISTRTVAVAAAEARSAGDLVARIPQGSQLVVSGLSGEWVTVYWPVNDAKRRLHVLQTSLSGGPIDPLSGWKALVGTWGERWSDVEHERNIRIEEANGRPWVKMEGWKVWDERVEGGVLTFRARGGTRDWEFLYTVKPQGEKMTLRVERVHDRQRFTGELVR